MRKPSPLFAPKLVVETALQCQCRPEIAFNSRDSLFRAIFINLSFLLSIADCLNY